MQYLAAFRRLRGLAGILSVAFGALLSQHSAAQGAAASIAIPTGPGSLAGVWVNAEYRGTGGSSARSRAIRTSDGGAPPLLPTAAALLEKRIKDADDDGDIFANTLAQCLPGGIPQMLFGAAAYPIQIIESPGQVSMLFEEQNHFRIIALNGSLPKDPDPAYMGYSVGHWEGDTLVIDTIGLNDRTTLDMVGTPHTEALHVTERYRRIAADRLEIRVTLQDPGAFSKPWEARTTWRMAPPGTQVGEYICENNRNAPDQEGHTSFEGPGK